MTAQVDFLPFAAGSGANVESQGLWAGESSLLSSGFQSGVVQSAKLNKVLRQSSIISAAIAQFISEQTGNDVIDDGTTTLIISGLVDSISAIIAASPGLFPDASTTTKGKVKLATNAQTIAGTDASLAVTPAGAKALFDTLSTWPGVYTGSNANNLTFPIGTNLFVVDTGYASHPRNSAQAIYLSAGDNYTFTTTSGGSALAGTWRVRGGYSSNTIYTRTA